VPWYRKGKVDPEQLRGAFAGTSEDPVGIDLQDGDRLENVMGELPIQAVDPDLFNAAKYAEESVPKISGVADVPWGGANTATESENINAVGGARMQRKKRLKLAFCTDVARKHLALRREFDPPGRTVQVVTPDGDALTLPYGREAFQGQLEVEVLAGGEALTVSPVRQKMLIEVGNQFLSRFSPKFDRIFARQVLTMLDFRDVNAMLGAMPRDAAEYMNLHNGGDGQARADAFNPNDQSTGQAIRAAINAPNEGAIV
jgi:hypothetical protein